ncbi:MAG: transketolase [Bacillota bacterium]
MEDKESSDLNILSSKEKQLIQFIRELGWGDMKIRIESGQPVLIYEAVRTIKLEDKTREQVRKSVRVGN